MSVFLDEKVLNYSEDISNRIIIGPVEGILKEPLQISVEANWENIFNIGLAGAQRVFSLMNVGLLNTGMWTRKYYKGGSYLRITPKIRVVNWDGNNDVIHKAKQLTDLCLPLYKGKSFNQAFEDITLAKVGSSIVGVGEEVLKDGGRGTVKKLIDQLSSNSPKPVMVTVSNFFKNYFIVESVNVEFSKEMTTQGPLYADIDLVLSTPEVTIRGGTGLKQTGKKWKNA
jgi:hypothetical protein